MPCSHRALALRNSGGALRVILGYLTPVRMYGRLRRYKYNVIFSCSELETFQHLASTTFVTLSSENDSCTIMHCACRVQVLQRFIQSFVQVNLTTDLPRLTSRSARSRGRNFREQSQHGRMYSTGMPHSQQEAIDHRASGIISIPLESGEPSRIDSQLGTYGDGQGVSSAAAAFIDISPEAIDALAAESKESQRLAKLLAEQIAGEKQEEAKMARGIQDRNDPASSPKPRSNRYDTRFNHENRRQDQARHGVHSAPRISYGTRTSKDWQELRYKGTGSSKSDGQEEPQRVRDTWMVQKETLRAKFPEGWNPRKRLSPDALEGIRALHAQMPERYTTSALAENFQVSPEVIRKILKSNWKPKVEEQESRAERWLKRGQKVWSRYAELGVKPPVKWRQLGIGKGKPEKRKRLSMEDVVVITPTKRTGPDRSPSEALEREVHGGSNSLSDQIL